MAARKQRQKMAIPGDFLFFSPFIVSGPPAYGRVLPTLQADLPLLVNPFWNAFPDMPQECFTNLLGTFQYNQDEPS
jgi:hypothetical protein